MLSISPVDFETEAIGSRPDEYPPKPVGVAVEINNKPKYLAWGHPTGNNCTKSEATRIVKDIYRNKQPVFHHAGFDTEVAEVHLGIKIPVYNRFECSLFLSYLHDPRDKSLELKVLASKYLGMPPDEQLLLKNWIIDNIFIPNKMKVTKKNPWGAYISKAPGDLVGKYAIGDIVRTKKLYRYFIKYIKEYGMLEAYEREKKCMEIFINEMSSPGTKVNSRALKKDLKYYTLEREKLERSMRRKLKAPDLEVWDGKNFANAMDNAGMVTHWIETEKGNRSTSKENLLKVCNDKRFVNMYTLHSVLCTYLNTFISRWASSPDGRIYPNFNQTRNTDAGGVTRGTRTGRPSSNNPNLLNVPRNVEDIRLPNMRDYIQPDDGCSIILRDYSQQELRILAHYEEGRLYNAYLQNPYIDVHDWVKDMIYEILNILYERSPVKNTNFGLIYGMGARGVAIRNNTDKAEARALIDAHKRALPDVHQLIKDLKALAREGEPLYTWGGRQYYCEEPTYVTNKYGRKEKRSNDYKLLNVLIQGSAADITKEAMIRTDEALSGTGSRLMLQVYDELAASTPKGFEKEGMILMRDAMESIELDIPMLTDGKVGKRNWGTAKKVNY